MLFHPVAAGMTAALSTQSLVNYLQGLFGPLFLGIVGIVAIFFLFTREIIRFVQFIVLAIAIAVIFYTPSIIQTIASGIANALGCTDRRSARNSRPDLMRFRASGRKEAARGTSDLHEHLEDRKAALQAV